MIPLWCRDSSVRIEMCYVMAGLDLHSVQTRSRAYPVSYPMDAEEYFDGGKAAGAIR
jgi:hypothetical protein